MSSFRQTSALTTADLFRTVPVANVRPARWRRIPAAI
jgi:hypothetical protein